MSQSSFIKLFYIGVVALTLGFFSCTKNSTTTNPSDPNPPIPDTPEISIIEVLPTNPQEYIDSIVFKIDYIDGDGDIGSPDPDATVVEIRDMRDPDIFFFEFHVSPRTPAGADIAIQGTLDIVLNHTILLDDNNQTEQTTFKIKLKDEAGNWSNEVETGTITISK